MSRPFCSGRSVALLLSALGAGTPLSAQSSDSVRLREIVVSATRSPTPLRAIGSSVTQISAEELRRRQVSSLREALQLMSGGTVLVNGAPGGVTSLFLRGVSSNQTLFLVDGIRANDADASYGSLLGGAEISGASRLEVVRGPQSTLYGGAAIGGVVSLDAAPGQGRIRGDAELEGGAFASWRGRLSTRGGIAGDRLGIAATLSANGTDNQRHPNDWHQRTELVRLDYRISPTLRSGTTFRGIQHDFTSPGDLRSTNTTPEGTTRFENNQGTLWLEATPSGRWTSRLLAGYQEQYNAGTSRYNGGPESVFTLRNTRKVLDWQNTLTLRPEVVLVAGANREWSTATSDTDELDQRLTGIYGEVQWLPVSAFSATAGIRSDDYNSFGRAVTFRLTGAWLIEGTGTKLRASLGSGFMPPSLAARFGGAFQNPNPEIRPERSQGWDAGVEQALPGGRGRIAVTWFRNSLRDLLGFESAPFPEKGRSVNIDRARTSGVELGGHFVVGAVDARVAYTLLSARSRSEPDQALSRLIRRPRHSATADALVSITSRLAVGAGAVVLADREDSDFNSFPSKRVNPGDYFLARLYSSWELGSFVLRLRAENLLNAHYEPVYGFPGLGRNLTGSLAVRY